MGNCQAAEAATVVIQHPGNKIQRIYWSVSAREIMNSNPGNYVALVVSSPTVKTENGLPLKQLKLLRPDDTLLIGHVYRLVSFEDVLKEFASKRSVKLGKLLKEKGLSLNPNSNPISKSENCSLVKAEQEVQGVGSNGDSKTTTTTTTSSSSSGSRGGVGRHHGGGGGQWKPALHSISEIGT